MSRKNEQITFDFFINIIFKLYLLILMIIFIIFFILSYLIITYEPGSFPGPWVFRHRGLEKPPIHPLIVVSGESNFFPGTRLDYFLREDLEPWLEVLAESKGWGNFPTIPKSGQVW